MKFEKQTMNKLGTQVLPLDAKVLNKKRHFSMTISYLVPKF